MQTGRQLLCNSDNGAESHDMTYEGIIFICKTTYKTWILIIFFWNLWIALANTYLRCIHTYVLYRLSMRHYVWTEGHSDGHKVQRQHNVPTLVIRMGCKQNAGGHAWSTLVACMNTKYRVCSCIKLSVHVFHTQMSYAANAKLYVWTSHSKVGDLSMLSMISHNNYVAWRKAHM